MGIRKEVFSILVDDIRMGTADSRIVADAIIHIALFFTNPEEGLGDRRPLTGFQTYQICMGIRNLSSLYHSGVIGTHRRYCSRLYRYRYFLYTGNGKIELGHCLFLLLCLLSGSLFSSGLFSGGLLSGSLFSSGLLSGGLLSGSLLSGSLLSGSLLSGGLFSSGLLSGSLLSGSLFSGGLFSGGLLSGGLFLMIIQQAEHAHGLVCLRLRLLHGLSRLLRNNLLRRCNHRHRRFCRCRNRCFRLSEFFFHCSRRRIGIALQKFLQLCHKSGIFSIIQPGIGEDEVIKHSRSLTGTECYQRHANHYRLAGIDICQHMCRIQNDRTGIYLIGFRGKQCIRNAGQGAQQYFFRNRLFHQPEEGCLSGHVIMNVPRSSYLGETCGSKSLQQATCQRPKADALQLITGL